MEFTTLSRGLRYLIEKRLQSSQRICVIATAIGVHRSTLYRELKRGSVNGRYDAAIAQQRADRRRATSTANHPQKTAALWCADALCPSHHGARTSAGSFGIAVGG